MATDLERLIVSLDADITRLSRQMARATGDVDTFTRKADASTKRAAKAINDNLQRGLRDDQLKNLGFQVNDVFSSLGSGAPVMQVLAQQGGQIYQALADTPGGAAAGVKDLASRFVGLLTPARLVAGGVATIGVAAALLGMRYSDMQDRIELGLSGVGRASGATVRDVNRVAEAVSRAQNISLGDATAAVTSIAATGKVGVGNLEGVASLAKGYAKLTGKDLPDAAQDLAKLFADPSKGAEELNAKIGALDDATLQYIKTLQMQGDRQQAINVLTKAVQPELDRAAKLTSFWGEVWNDLGSAASRTAGIIGRFVSGFKGMPLEDQLAFLQQQRQALAEGGESGYAKELRDSGLSDDDIRKVIPSIADPAQLKKLDDAIAAITKRLEDAKQAAGDVGARDLSIQAGQIIRALDPMSAQIREAEADLVTLGKAIAATISNPDVKLDGGVENAIGRYGALTTKVDLLKKSYAAGGAAAKQALDAADFDKSLVGLSNYERGLQTVVRRFQEMAEAARLAGNEGAAKGFEAAGAKAVEAYKAQSAEAAKSEVILPEGFVRAVFGAEGNNPAKNPKSSASGYGQFLDSTFVSLYRKEFSNIAEGMTDAAILGLKQDRAVNEKLTEAYGRENAKKLQDAGFAPTLENLYLAHNYGPTGATNLLRAAQEGRGDASGRSVLGDKVADANPAVARNDVQGVIAESAGRARRYAGQNIAAADRVRQIDAETASIGKSVTETERRAEAEEYLNRARERGDEIANRFKTADEALKANTSLLTGELKAQTEELQRNADARAQAAARRLGATMSLDLRDAYGALGRTPGEQQDFLTARRFGAEGSESFQNAYSQLQDLRALTEAKSTGSGFVKDLVYDMQRGVGFAEALSGALSRLTSKLLDKGIDALLNIGFGGGNGGGLGSIVSAIGTAVTGGSAIPRLAVGGSVSGPGTGTSDSIPAMLSNGEFIVNSRAARANLPLLRAINSGRARGYAAGGVVGTVGAMPAVAMARPAVPFSMAFSMAGDTINITPAEGVTPPQMLAALAQRDAKLRRDINGIVANGRKRYRTG